jgi:hypothetical protein
VRHVEIAVAAELDGARGASIVTRHGETAVRSKNHVRSIGERDRVALSNRGSEHLCYRRGCRMIRGRRTL